MLPESASRPVRIDTLGGRSRSGTAHFPGSQHPATPDGAVNPPDPATYRPAGNRAWPREPHGSLPLARVPFRVAARAALAWALALVALPGISARAQSGGNGPRITYDLIKKIECLMPQALCDFDVPGAALALVQDGCVVYANGFGVRDLATQECFTADTIHRVGSTSKSMTSMVAAIYVERGLFGFNTPVRSISPLIRFPTAELNNTLTVRQVMGMGTGLGESQIFEEVGDLATPRYYFANLPNLPILVPPGTPYGTLYYYNNNVYALGGHVISLAQGVPVSGLEEAYARTMKRELFDPIGMPTAKITNDPSDMGNNVARSYAYDLRFGEQPDRFMPYQSLNMISPAGAAAMSIEDLARYLITQLNGGVTPDGRRLVSRDVLAETWQGQTRMPGFGQSYAMGWVDLSEDGIPYLYHSGEIDGFSTDMSMIQDANIGILIFANADTGHYLANAIRGRILQLLYGHPQNPVGVAQAAYNQYKAKIHAWRSTVTAYQVPRRAVAPFLGRYAKGWQVVYSEGLPMLSRASGHRLVLLPTDQGYLVGSTNESDGLGLTVTFGTDDGGRMHFQMWNTTNPNDWVLVDDVPRLSR